MANSGNDWIEVTFDWCVNLLYLIAQRLGVTYEEVNVWLFVVTLPTLLLTSIIINICLALKIASINHPHSAPE